MYGLYMDKRTIIKSLSLYWPQLNPKNLRALKINSVGAVAFFYRHLYM